MEATIDVDARYIGPRQRFACDAVRLLHCSIQHPPDASRGRCSPHRAGQLADPSASR
ncbi:hypothetical protein QE373_003496 [Stenotrophomonas sp. SORGH_AS321]|nr:hypothetical protein [Stenotrophomonas sp. SORGH_AS_0321]